MDKKNRILVIEDELDIAESIVEGLESQNYQVKHVADGQNAIRLLDYEQWDLVILDLMLPDISGEAILNYLTQKMDYPPVLVLTAKSLINDKLSLFKMGCDDYLVKPFFFEELHARLQALLRRPPRVQKENLNYQNIILDIVQNHVTADLNTVSLTPKEVSLLRLLMSEPRRIFSRKEILQSVWGLKEEPSANYIGIHLFNLRKKLAQINKENWLQTVRSSGFVLCDPEIHQYGD